MDFGIRLSFAWVCVCGKIAAYALGGRYPRGPIPSRAKDQEISFPYGFSGVPEAISQIFDNDITGKKAANPA
jgi:hypothetical protein